MIKELKYSNTNTYLIDIDGGYLLFDTGWAGTFPMFCKALGEMSISAQDIKYILISHYHPDHMGIAQEIANLGARIIVADVQKDYIHFSDSIFQKDGKLKFYSIEEDGIIELGVSESRGFFGKIGLNGEILYTPGHSDDSVTLYMDEGVAIVGDLNPLYELELHKGTVIEKSWQLILDKKPNTVYYGHAKTARLLCESSGAAMGAKETADVKSDNSSAKLYSLVSQIMAMIDKGKSLEKIKSKTKADATFIEDVTRMYLTHQNISVQGILDRIEIKGK